MKKPTVTVAIPALNEENNIKTIIMSILAQNQTYCTLEKILVINDQSTDKTAQIVKALAKKYKSVHLVERPKREGKAMALNMAYDLNTSDFLLTIDADCALGTKGTIDAMVKRMIDEPRLNAVGPRHVPLKPDTIMGKFAWVSYLSFEDAFLAYNNGYNFYTSMSGQLLRRSFVDSFRFPLGTLSDQIYLYAKATEHDERAFELVRDAELIFTTVTTFHDWRVLAVRATAGDKDDAVSRFGSEILSRYTIPRSLFIKSQLKWLVMHPILMTGSLAMNMFVRFFPLKQQIVKNGMWIATSSSKKDISMSNLHL